MPLSRANLTTDHLPDRASLRAAPASTAVPASQLTADLDDEDAPFDGVALGLKHERFRIGDQLGEGGMGVVYHARDSRDGRDVALKVMKTTLAGSARRRFEREFRSLSSLHHPHCLRVFDYGELGGVPFFTMELFQGRPITSLAGLGVDLLLEPLRQLTLALDYIHGHGIVHRDVKPSNILVRATSETDGSRGFEIKLMDFGLAKFYGVKSSLSGEAGFAGTVAYCSPEQLNLDELDHRADLYCLGLVSYELLSGRYPFPDARLAGMRPLIQAQLNDKPRALGELNPEVPGPIADAVMRYLRKEPRRRPDSAALLRSAIADHLGLDDPTDVSLVVSAPARPFLSVTGFVCRSHEQETLDEVVRHCLRPAGITASDRMREVPPSMVIVSGEAGIGKSSVVREAERLARGHGCQVYEGRCFDGNLSPFQPFVEIVRQLIAELRLQERREAATPADADLTGTHVAGMPAESLARLLAIVNDYGGELLRIAPELRKYLAGHASRQVDFGREPEYIYRALSAFFLEIATLQPVCLSFEDLQWADKSSHDLLLHLSAALASARRFTTDGPTTAPRLVIVASARDGYPQLEALKHQLAERHQARELRLAPLAEGETRELIALRLNCRPEELSGDLVSRVHELCGGNPFFVCETVREWYEKHAIARSDDGWVLATFAGDASDLPDTVRDAMRLRLQGLPSNAIQVLGAAAVIGAVVDIDLLADVLPDLSEGDVLDAIDLLLPRRVFRETGNAGRVQFVHDLLRELSYGDLTAARRRSLHRRVGELLERRREQGQNVSAAVMADHFTNAEDRPKALDYVLEAAKAALNAYAFNNAIAHLSDALQLAPENTDAPVLYRIWNMLGAANGATGLFDEAVSAFREALKYSGDRIARASAHHGIGEAYHRKGQIDDAVNHFDLALCHAGYPRPHSLPGRLLDMSMACAYVHILPTWAHVPDSNLGRDERIEIAFATYYRLAWIEGSLNLIDYVHSCYRMAALAKQSKKAEHRAVACSKFGLNLGMFSLHWLAMVYGRRAQRAAEHCGGNEIRAMARAHVGMALYMGGRLDAAEIDLQEAFRVLDKVRDTTGMVSHHFLRHLYAVRGDIPRELAEAEEEIAIATKCDDVETLAWGQYGKANALARAGRTDEAQSLATRAVEATGLRSSGTLAVACGVVGYVRLQASDYPGAREALERSRACIKRKLFLVEFVGPTFPLLVESLLGPRWADAEGAPTREVVRKACRESRFARFIGWRFPNYRPHALRVSGRAAFALGKTKKARQYFERAIAAAEALGARYDRARALLDASLVIPTKADDYRRYGLQLLDELGAVVPEAERLSL